MTGSAVTQRAVYRALMQDRKLRLYYRKHDTDAPTVYQPVRPLAVVQRRGLIYLDCVFAAYEDVRTIALHRSCTPRMLYGLVRKKPHFDIDLSFDLDQG